MKYVPITRDNSIAVRFSDLFVQLSKFCQLPDNLEYCTIEDGRIFYTHSIYHNESEEVLITTDSDKIEVAKALMTLRRYVNNMK